jgi:1-acyl-sn-glycerol-3-phosphate acyltransferase
MSKFTGLQLPNRVWRHILRVVLATSCRLHIVNQKVTKRPGPWILASNHISHFDPPLWSLLAHRPLDWMAMEELFRSRIFAFLLRSVGAFPVRRGTADRAALRTAGQHLAQGRVLGIFPEGGIRDGAASITAGAPLRPGVTLLAHHHHVPILPCVILGSDRLYLGKNWLPLRRVPIWAICGDFLEPSSGKNRHELDATLAGIFPKLTEKLVRHYRLTPEDWPKSPQVRLAEPPLPWPKNFL